MSKPRPIKLKLDVKKILKEHLFAGAKGTYLDLVVWPNKDGTDQYGNTHYVVQELSRAARDAGERGPIIGNLTLPEDEAPQQRQAPPPRQQAQRPAPQQQAQDNFGTEPISNGMEEDDIPF